MTGYEQNGEERIKNPMLRFEPEQPVAESMEDQKEITGDKNRIDHEFGCKRSQAFGSILFHDGRLTGRSLNTEAFTFEEIRASATLRLRLTHEQAHYCVRSLSS